MNQLPLWATKYLYIGLGAAYFILPWDFDMAGFIGRLDDLAVIAFLYYRYQKIKKEQSQPQQDTNEQQQTRTEDQRQQSRQKQESTSQQGNDPYVVLGVSREDSLSHIEKRYKELARQYHPDRVNHLGPELQDMAHQKMLAIQEAYEILKKRHA